MQSLSARFPDRTVLMTLIAVGAAVIVSFVLMPRFAHASAVTVSAFTATTTPAYTNTGLATTTRAKVGDTIQYQLTLSGGAPLISPQINILGTGSTTMTGSANNWYYATTTTSNASVWNDGTVTFKVSVGQDTLVGTATTTVTALTSGSNITFDKTGPQLSSVSWSDVDGSTQFSATDTLTLTFNETMATTTITSGNVDTTLALSGSHTFGTSPTVSWDTAGTVLTLTLGTSPTLATADTIDPSTAVKDAIGNSDATPSALTITDNIAPGNPTGLTTGSYSGSVTISLASVGSSQIRFTTDGTIPSCSVGTVYGGSFTITGSSASTVNAIGCDEANNASSVVSATYTGSSSGGGGGGGGGSYHPRVVPTEHLEGCKSGSGDVFDVTNGKSCAEEASSDEGCAPGNSFSITSGRSCSTRTTSAGPATGGARHEFMSDSTVGSSGDEVKTLQAFLNTHGYSVASSGPGSSGNETTMFGGLTRAALIRYQKAKGITPAVGYFGPKTRTAVNADQ